MTQQDCLRLLREVKDVAFATVDETGRPQVRMIDVMLVENGRLYFCTARGKNFYRQLITSGWTALTGMNREFQMVRLSGPVHRVAEQKKWIDRIFEENPAMKQVYPGDSRYVLEPFCIESGQMEFFDLGKFPIYRKTFSFGGAELLNVGFQITDACIECGRCRRICPQQCIESGSPYVIRQQNCLHCGLCQEQCPVQAIERKGE